MAQNDEIEELKETVHEVLEWKTKQEQKEEVSRQVSAIVKVRCTAAVSAGTMILGFLGWLASKFSDALDAGFRAFIRALTEGAGK